MGENAPCPGAIHQPHSPQHGLCSSAHNPPSLPQNSGVMRCWCHFLTYRPALVVYWNCTGFVRLLVVSVWCVKSVGGTTASLAPVTPGGKSFPLTSVETSPWGALAGAAHATVNQGLFSGSRWRAENVIPGN